MINCRLGTFISEDFFFSFCLIVLSDLLYGSLEGWWSSEVLQHLPKCFGLWWMGTVSPPMQYMSYNSIKLLFRQLAHLICQLYGTWAGNFTKFDVVISTKSDLNVKWFLLIFTLLLIWPRKVLSVGRWTIQYMPQKHLSFRMWLKIFMKIIQNKFYLALAVVQHRTAWNCTYSMLYILIKDFWNIAWSCLRVLVTYSDQK